jgi:hypothetical protein
MNLTMTGNTIEDPGSFGSWGLVGESGVLTGDSGSGGGFSGGASCPTP